MLGLGTELRHAAVQREGGEKCESAEEDECAWVASVDVHSLQANSRITRLRTRRWACMCKGLVQLYTLALPMSQLHCSVCDDGRESIYFCFERRSI